MCGYAFGCGCESGRRYEWRGVAGGVLEAGPAGSSLLTAAASPATHASYSASAGMFLGMIRRLGA